MVERKEQRNERIWAFERQEIERKRRTGKTKRERERVYEGLKVRKTNDEYFLNEQSVSTMWVFILVFGKG